MSDQYRNMTGNTISILDSIEAPFGSWPMDKEELTSAHIVHNSGSRAIFRFDDGYAAKTFLRGDPKLEMKMMILAGPECAVQPVGRLFIPGKGMTGFVMPYETALHTPAQLMEDDSSGIRPPLDREEKRKLITQLSELVKRLHSKNIIHGDIKPSNILLCSDGEVRFCDLACATFEGESKYCPSAVTVQYVSPHWSLYPGKPLIKADDLYALGVTIWEIWVEKTPFESIDDDWLDEVISTGHRPDMKEIDDEDVARTIMSYLDCGLPLPDNSGQARSRCMQFTTAFKDCKSDLPHTFTKRVKCRRCARGDGNRIPCEGYFEMPLSPDPSFTIPCPVCFPIEYSGIEISTSRDN